MACGFGVSYLALYLFNHFPEYFMPLYKNLKAQYLDFQSNPNLRRLTNDNRAAIRHMGFYLGFLFFEVGRRDWKNVKLILTVGIVNGLGWAMCQNWQWAARLWPDAHFNFWRCWESSGGISIGIAYGLAYYFVNRRMSNEESACEPELSLSCFGGEGRGEEAHQKLEPLRPPAPSTETSLQRSAGVVAITASSPRPSPPEEERGRSQAMPGHLVSQTQPQWGLAQGRINLEWLAVYLLVLLALGLFFIPALRRGWGALYFGLAGAFGIAYYLLNRGQPEGGGEGRLPSREDPNLERFGAYVGLLLGLGMSIRNGLKGWFNIYVGNERYWDRILWQIAGPLLLVCLLAILARLLLRRLPRHFQGDAFPHSYRLIWLVLIVQNLIAQLITGPHSSWPEVAFAIYYVLLFFISAVIVYHFHLLKVTPK